MTGTGSSGIEMPVRFSPREWIALTVVVAGGIFGFYRHHADLQDIKAKQGQILDALQDHEGRLARIEASRFTKDDAAAVQLQIASLANVDARTTTLIEATNQRLAGLEARVGQLVDAINNVERVLEPRRGG